MMGQVKLPQMGRIVAGAAIVAAGLGLASAEAAAKEYIVKFKSQTQFQAGARDLAASDMGQVFDEHAEGNLVGIRFSTDDPRSEAEQLARLMKRPDVDYVVENIKLHMFNAPNDPQYPQQWALEKVKAEAAWAVNPGSKDVVVAVIDTGIDYRHPDLKDNMWTNPGEVAGNGIDDDGNGFVDDIHGWDFRQNDADPYDTTSSKNPGHGTHCAGIIGAVANNGQGISGMAQNVSLMAVRFLGEDGSGDLMSGAKAVDYAVKMGVDIISASWGAAAPASAFGPVLEAIQRASDKGIIFVAAAANDGKNNDIREVYPANADYPNVISVAASQSDDTKPSWSNFGKRKVHLSSPGHEILSTIPENAYRKLSGTSMATPLVSGLVALMVSQMDDKKIDGMAARSVLQATGQNVNIETTCDCRVDAAAALDHVAQDKLTLVPNSITLAPSETQSFGTFGGNGPFEFSIDNADIGTIDSSGNFTAKAEGEATITVKDATGATAQSKKIRIAPQEEGGGGGEACPLQDPTMCQLMCMFDPTLPWCAD